jgi:hypothetical protein
MVTTTQVDSIHVHASIVSPIIGESKDDLETLLLGKGDDLVEPLQTIVAIVYKIT